MNHLYRKSAFPEEFWPIALATAITAEDKVWYDTSAKILRPLTNDTNAASFVGVCMDTVPVNINGTNTSPNPPLLQARVVKVGQFTQICTTGESYTAGQLVYASATGTQYVTNVGGTHAVGYVSGEQADITTATAGQTVLICLRANYPILPLN